MPWTLESPEERAAQAPRSFFIPPPDTRHGLEAGDVVKLIFRLEPEDGEAVVERMWVEVVETEPYAGRLVNEPRTEGVLAYGDRVEFGPEHVCAYAYTQDQLRYDGGAACFVSEAVRGDVPPDGLHVDAGGMWAAFAEGERPEHRWTLGDLTDRFPETEEALREGRELREAWWRREGERYVRWQA